MIVVECKLTAERKSIYNWITPFSTHAPQTKTKFQYIFIYIYMYIVCSTGYNIIIDCEPIWFGFSENIAMNGKMHASHCRNSVGQKSPSNGATPHTKSMHYFLNVLCISIIGYTKMLGLKIHLHVDQIWLANNHSWYFVCASSRMWNGVRLANVCRPHH